MKININRENSVHFVVKKEWFEKIKSGEKTHEYRLYKPFWTKRLTYCNTLKFLPLPKKYAKFSLGMSKEPAKNMIFEIKNISLVRAKETDLVKINPELEKTAELAIDIELGERIIEGKNGYKRLRKCGKYFWWVESISSSD